MYRAASNEYNTYRYWLVYGRSYMEHPCKVWFGHPTQVWTAVLSPDFNFFMLSEISNRVVFVETKFKFGRAIGEDTVLIVTPIPFYFEL